MIYFSNVIWVVPDTMCNLTQTNIWRAHTNISFGRKRNFAKRKYWFRHARRGFLAALTQLRKR